MEAYKLDVGKLSKIYKFILSLVKCFLRYRINFLQVIHKWNIKDKSLFFKSKMYALFLKETLYTVCFNNYGPNVAKLSI